MGVLAVLAALSGCAAPHPREDAVSSMPVRLVTPVGGLFGSAGDVAAETVQDFRVLPRRDFVIAEGSLLRGAYTLAPKGSDEAGEAGTRTWILTVDWQVLKGRGASRIPDAVSDPPFVTVHGIETDAGLPDLAKGVEIPIMYADPETRDVGRKYLVPLDAPLRLNEAPEDRREAGPD